jgi:hypothetical protein
MTSPNSSSVRAVWRGIFETIDSNNPRWRRVPALTTSTPGLFVRRERQPCECWSCDDGYTDRLTHAVQRPWSWILFGANGYRIPVAMPSYERAQWLAAQLGALPVDWSGSIEYFRAEVARDPAWYTTVRRLMIDALLDDHRMAS